MKISYKPLWKTLIDKNMSKKDLRLQAHLTTNHIANMGKGEHISMQTLIKICETLNCDIVDVIALVPDNDPEGRKGITMELTYTKVGDYYIPDLILDEDPATEKFYGKYGDLRRTYLREHKPKLWMVLVNTGRADDHLTSIEREAEQRMDTLLPQMMKAAGVTEELKARDQMAWVGLMNNCKARVEEIILADLIYC